MAGNGNRNNGNASPMGLVLIAIHFFVVAHYWPRVMGGEGAALYTGLFRGAGWVCVLGAVVSVFRARLQHLKRKLSEKASGVFGRAAFATADECEENGLFDPKGLYLGLLDGRPLFYRGKAHLLTCAPARQGKGIGFVIPNLLHYLGSVIVTDPKGELAAVTARHRREVFGQDVVVFNPWGLHGLPQHRINPLEILIRMAGDPALWRGLADEVRAIVMQLLPEPEDTRNRFFRDGARSIMFFVLLYLALYVPKCCTLPELSRIIGNPKRLGRVVEAMRREEAMGGYLADLADDLAQQMEDNPDLFGDFRAGAVQQLSIFEPSGYLADAVSASDVSLADLKAGNVTLYLVFPPERVASHGAALGLIVQQAITAVSRAPERGEVLFLLDEFANLGKLSGLAESLTALPGLGVRVWMVVQELAEITRLYGPNTAQTVRSQSEVQQYFAVNTDERAQALSKELGQKTVKTRNFNLGRAQTDDIGESLSEAGQPLMRPEEIRALASDQQLLLVKGMKPILANRMPFWFAAPWGEWAAPNPVEGDYPKVKKPIFTLTYTATAEE